MKTADTISAIKNIVKKYPQKESAMLPALYYMQQHNDNSPAG